MQEALDYAAYHGKLFRYVGGFWSHKGFPQDHFQKLNTKDIRFTTNTIEALERRGLLKSNLGGGMSPCLPPLKEYHVSEGVIKELTLETRSPIVPATEDQEAYYDMGYYRYPMSLLTEALKVYNKSAPHPEPVGKGIKNISHLVKHIQIDEEGTLRSEIELLDTPAGRIIRDLIEAGTKFHSTLSCHGNLDDLNFIANADSLSVNVEPYIVKEN